MAITTQERITRGGLEIGISKLFSELYADGDLTPQELARFSYAAWEAPECNAHGTTEIDISSKQGAAVSTQMSYFQAPMGGEDYVSEYINGLIPTGRLYAFNVILYTSSNYEFITTDNAENVRLITDIDLSSCAMTIKESPYEDDTASIDYPEARTIKKLYSGASIYQHDDNLLKHWDSDYNVWRAMNNIHPYCIIANDSGILFITHGSYFGGHEMTGFGTYAFNLSPINYLELPYGDNLINQKWSYETNDITDFTKSKHLLRWIGNDQSYPPQTWASGTKSAAWDYDDNFYIIMEQTNQVYGIANDKYYIYPKNLNIIKRLIACVGLNVYIGDNKNSVIKPIITGGMVVGYSEDAATPSEIDKITNVTGNNISPFSPGGGGGGTDEDDPWHGVKYGTGGYGSSPFCTSYAMTGAELTQLAAWGGKPESEGGPKAGYDYMPSIISLVEMPMAVSGTVPSTVKFSRGTLGGYESNIVDTGVSGNPITAATQRYNLGSVTLPLRMSNRGYPFLDWDTVVELYMPFVGMFSLDPFAVLGRTITAFMELDVLNGTICGYAYVTNNGEKLPVAYGSAQVGVSLPITSDGAATARLALTTANAQLGSSFASSALQLGTMAAAGGASAVKGGNAWSAMQSARGAGLAAQTGRSIFAGGASDAVSGYATSSAIGSIANSFVNWGLSLKQLQSSNNTQVNGSMGGGSFSGWSTPNQAYVKIIRPHAAPGAKASEYGNTHAYPFEDNAKLKDCKGLTFAVNPNVSGITKATDAERAQIAEILMGGVIA